MTNSSRERQPEITDDAADMVAVQRTLEETQAHRRREDVAEGHADEHDVELWRTAIHRACVAGGRTEAPAPTPLEHLGLGRFLPLAFALLGRLLFCFFLAATFLCHHA